MRPMRMKADKQWENIGFNAARKGYDLEVVLTKSESVNVLIRKGYEKGSRKAA